MFGNLPRRIAMVAALGLLLFVATPGAQAHQVSCTGDPIQGGLCLILCDVEHSITAPPHSCTYTPTCPETLENVCELIHTP